MALNFSSFKLLLSQTRMSEGWLISLPTFPKFLFVHNEEFVMKTLKPQIGNDMKFLGLFSDALEESYSRKIKQSSAYNDKRVSISPI